MASKVGLPSNGLLTDIDTGSARNVVGTRRFDDAGNEFIYLVGVASVATGTWVTFDHLFATTRLVANGLGPVAVAMGAAIASTWGWFQIYGLASGLAVAQAASTKVWATSTAGSVSSTDVAVDLVVGAVCRVARDSTSGLAGYWLNYPFAHNEVLN